MKLLLYFLRYSTYEKGKRRNFLLLGLVICCLILFNTSIVQGDHVHDDTNTLTNFLIQKIQAYQEGRILGKAQIEEKLREIASERKAALLDLLETNPEAVLLNTLPKGIRDQKPKHSNHKENYYREWCKDHKHHWNYQGILLG